MKASISIIEYQNARKQLDERLNTLTPTRPLGIALLDLAISLLSQLNTPQDKIRELCELAISLHRNTSIAMPTQGEIAKLLGWHHDKETDG